MFPAALKPLSNYFRRRRNRALVAIIDEIYAEKHSGVEVLDIGGSIIFWMSVAQEARAKCRVSLLNLPGAYDDLPENEAALKKDFALLIGDARDLSRYGDKKFDLVVCSSVIEHVGAWNDMEQTAQEAIRVGRRGFVQVPAFEFPIEQHFLLPFIHWLAAPIQVFILKHVNPVYRKASFSERLMGVHHTRPLTSRELKALFPEARIAHEWLIFPKSHMAMW